MARQEAELADGSRAVYDIIGPVEIRLKNRNTSYRAVVLPGNAEVLLDFTPRQDMDVLIDPKNQSLIVIP